MNVYLIASAHDELIAFWIELWLLLNFRRSVFQVLTLAKVDELLSPGAYRVLLALGATWVSLFVLGYVAVFMQFVYEIPQSRLLLNTLRRVGMLNASVSPPCPQ